MKREDNLRSAIRRQNLKIVIWGVLALLLLVLVVLEAFLHGAQTLEIAKQFRVSSALVAVGSDEYICSLDGALVNSSDEVVHLDRVAVEVSGREGSDTVVLESIDLYPRFDRDISVTWQASVAYERIDRISITVGDETDVLVNRERTSPLDGVMLFYLILLLLDALLLTRASMIRYYLHQEEQAGL